MKIKRISKDKIKLHNDFKQIFGNVNHLEKKEGNIEVFLRNDGFYELISGYQKFHHNNIKSIVVKKPKDDLRILMLRNVLSEIGYTPLQYARAISYYIEEILIPNGITKRAAQDRECSVFFNISKSSIYKYNSLLKLILPLQMLADNKEYPYTAFVSAHRLTEDNQKILYHEIISRERDVATRNFIERTVQELLIEQGDKIKMPRNNASDKHDLIRKSPRNKISLSDIVREYKQIAIEDNTISDYEIEQEYKPKEIENNGVFTLYDSEYPPSDDIIDDVLKDMIKKTNYLMNKKMNDIELAYISNILIKLTTIAEINSSNKPNI